MVNQHFKNSSNEQSINLQHETLKYITGIGDESNTNTLKDFLRSNGYITDPKEIEKIILQFEDLRNNLKVLANENKLGINEATKKMETLLGGITKVSEDITKVNESMSKRKDKSMSETKARIGIVPKRKIVERGEYNLKPSKRTHLLEQ